MLYRRRLLIGVAESAIGVGEGEGEGEWVNGQWSIVIGEDMEELLMGGLLIADC